MNKSVQDMKEELKELSPFLLEMKDKKQPIKEVPEHYFDFLENSIMEQVSLEQTPTLQTTTGQRVSIYSIFFNWKMGLSLSVLFLVVAAFIFQKGMDSTGNAAMQFSDLTYDEMYQYMNDNIDTFDEYSLTDEENSALDLIEINTESATEYLLEGIETSDLEDLL